MRKAILLAAVCSALCGAGAVSAQEAANSQSQAQQAEPGAKIKVPDAPSMMKTGRLPQANYPFAQPKKLDDREHADIRDSVVTDTVGTLLAPPEIGAVNNRKLDAQGANVYPGYAGRPLQPLQRKDIFFDANSPLQGAEQITMAQYIPAPISFEDDYGNPWPIAAVAYDPKVYSVNGQGCGASGSPVASAGARPTVLTVNVCRYWTWGSFSVQLEGLNTPVVLVANSGDGGAQEVSAQPVDVPIIVHVAGLSPTGEKPEQPKPKPKPKSKAPVDRDTGPDAAYQAFLNYTPPRGAMAIRTSDPNSRAWFFGGQIYLVTPYKVITPQYGAVAHDDGKSVYKMSRVVSRVLASDNNGGEHVILLSAN